MSPSFGPFSLCDGINGGSADGVFKGSEYKFPPSLALVTLDSAGSLHRDDDSTSRIIIPLADMGARRADGEDESASETARREMQPEERI